jgi:hypothetical protein
MLKGFTLVDVMMGVVLTTVLLFLMTGFVRDVLFYHKALAQHQEIRSDLFRITHDVFPEVLRKATGIDYAQSNDRVLSVFIDAYEQETVQFLWREDSEGFGELVYQDDDQEFRLHAQQTVIEALEWNSPEHPASLGADRLLVERALQPLVTFRIQASFRSNEALARPIRLAYQGAAALRKVSFSSYRHDL